MALLFSHKTLSVFIAILLVLSPFLIAVHANDTAKVPTLRVVGEGSSKAPLTLADISLSILVNSVDFGTDRIRDIETIGDVPKLPNRNDRQHEFAFTRDNGSEAVFCASCVQKELIRRSSSLINYIRWLNFTDLTKFSISDKIDTKVITNPNGNGFESLRTASITTRPEYRWIDSENKLVGYVGHAVVVVRVPSEFSHFILNKALSVGASDIQSANLVATQADLTAHQLIADTQAATVAFDRAKNVLSTLNLHLAKINKIEVGEIGTSPAQPPMFERALNFAASATQSDSGILVGRDVSVPSSVMLEIQYS